jgi:hypothetical protein
MQPPAAPPDSWAQTRDTAWGSGFSLTHRMEAEPAAAASPGARSATHYQAAAQCFTHTQGAHPSTSSGSCAVANSRPDALVMPSNADPSKPSTGLARLFSSAGRAGQRSLSPDTLPPHHLLPSRPPPTSLQCMRPLLRTTAWRRSVSPCSRSLPRETLTLSVSTSRPSCHP